MTNFDLSPEAIQAHLNNGARMRAEAIHATFANIGSAISGTFRSAANALTGDWTNSRAA
jgi:hypothetical protein